MKCIQKCWFVCALATTQDLSSVILASRTYALVFNTLCSVYCRISGSMSLTSHAKTVSTAALAMANVSFVKRIVFDVVDKNIDSSSKSNLLHCRRIFLPSSKTTPTPSINCSTALLTQKDRAGAVCCVYVRKVRCAVVRMVRTTGALLFFFSISYA